MQFLNLNLAGFDALIYLSSTFNFRQVVNNLRLHNTTLPAANIMRWKYLHICVYMRVCLLTTDG